MIAFLLQARLSSFLRYRSLYEGQVPTRCDSPAHYLEHIRIALGLLGRQDLQLTNDVGHLDFLRLLQSQVRFDLPDDMELTLGSITEKNRAAGKRVSDLYRELAEWNFEVVAILRHEHLILPHSETVLERGDRLVLIVSADACEPLAGFVTSGTEGDGGVQLETSSPIGGKSSF